MANLIKVGSNVAEIIVGPAITAKRAERQAIAFDAGAVILIVYATGTLPTRMAEFVKKFDSAGVPVFLVSNNPGENTGILHATKYEVTIPSLQAGAVPIEKVNVNGLTQLHIFIQSLLDKGIKGDKLKEKVRERFSYKEGEEKPLSEWETPEGIAKRRKLVEQTFRNRLKLKGDALAKALRDWEFGPGQDGSQIRKK